MYCKVYLGSLPSTGHDMRRNAMKVTLSLEFDDDGVLWPKFAEFIASLEKTHSPSGGVVPSKDLKAEANAGRSWRDTEMQAIWNGITSDARRLVKMIARREGGLSLSELKRVLGVDHNRGGNAIGGMRSSIGHQMNANKLNGKLPDPIILKFRASAGDLWYDLRVEWRSFILGTSEASDESP
jgi:hypothetical protein